MACRMVWDYNLHIHYVRPIHTHFVFFFSTNHHHSSCSNVSSFPSYSLPSSTPLNLSPCPPSPLLVASHHLQNSTTLTSVVDIFTPPTKFSIPSLTILSMNTTNTANSHGGMTQSCLTSCVIGNQVDNLSFTLTQPSLFLYNDLADL